MGGKTQTSVNCAWMDGRNKAILWRKSSIPTSLVFSSQGNLIYWADVGEELENSGTHWLVLVFLCLCAPDLFKFPPGEGVISYINIDGSGYKQFKTAPGMLISFTHTENLLLWVTLDKGKDETTFLFLIIRLKHSLWEVGIYSEKIRVRLNTRLNLLSSSSHSDRMEGWALQWFIWSHKWYVFFFPISLQ